MKTMGFNDLLLVSPTDNRALGRKKCVESACGALDVLKGARVFESLEEAWGLLGSVNDNDEGSSGSDGDEQSQAQAQSRVIICGTGMPIDMRNKRPQQRYATPRKYFEEILAKHANANANDNANVNTNDNTNQTIEATKTIRIAFLFGNERYGMTPRDISKCDIMLGIPTNPQFGSLNLASAVQLIAYDWREAIGGFGSGSGSGSGSEIEDTVVGNDAERVQ